MASSAAAKDKQVIGTPALKDRQPTPASTLDQKNQPSSTPTRQPSVKSKSKPRLLPRTPSQPPAPKPAEVGFIPGRSFVGRVLEVGWELGDEVIRKGEWVIGLVDVRKVGLSFILFLGWVTEVSFDSLVRLRNSLSSIGTVSIVCLILGRLFLMTIQMRSQALSGSGLV
jgi:hypothetical protein